METQRTRLDQGGDGRDAGVELHLKVITRGLGRTSASLICAIGIVFAFAVLLVLIQLLLNSLTSYSLF